MDKLKFTEQNVKELFELVTQQLSMMKHDTPHCEFDEETTLRFALNTLIDWVEEFYNV